MNIIASSLTALALSVATIIPVHAQHYTDREPIFLESGHCMMGTKTSKLPCQRLVITGVDMNTKTLNFHFEDKTGFGITFVTSKVAKQTKHGVMYDLIAIMMQENGEFRAPIRIEGGCLLLDSNKGQVFCTTLDAPVSDFVGLYVP